MASKMLIDATHPEETRLVVLRGDRVEEFDFESAARKLLRGNIYLAKVTRVEPSLQAAFVEYGGNRHGFLAFSDIHPDYYQIPVADRQALLAAEAEAAEEEERRLERRSRPRRGGRGRSRDSDFAGEESGSTPAAADAADEGGDGEREPAGSAVAAEAAGDPIIREEPVADAPEGLASGEAAAAAREGTQRDAAEDSPVDTGHQIGLVEDEGVEEVGESEAEEEPEEVESVGSDDDLEEVTERRRRPLRSYKIQEVVRRRQIMLVQVVKEERGNKGAALTTYLSLAGRYTVLMPNSGRGGGISRKITSAGDRKRLKEIATDLEVPEGMGLIVRTAGASRTRQEIKRDFEYLLRLWESVRDLTLRSTAPALVYEEGDLIRRSLRDLYSEDVDEVIVSGNRAYEEARDFMRMLMPSHAKNVRHFQDAEPLFTRFPVERQLAAIYSPYVTLKSGGYIVINQTEALVSIDVNSGKSTREHSIEETALATNLEAADEIARQLRLRDLAGLVVVDFIDMEERRNNRHVERRLKEALRHDRARIQVGRISHFGLLEMSRQRLRTGVVEGSTSQCPHCLGTGIIRSTESVALSIIRATEERLLSGARHNLTVAASLEAALYLLNEKREHLRDMEGRYGVTITVVASDKLHGANFTIERGAVSTRQPERKPRSEAAVQMDWAFEAGEGEEDVRDEDVEALDREAEEPAVAEGAEREAREEDGDGRKSRRRRRRRGGRGGERSEGSADARANGSHAYAAGSDEQPSIDTEALAGQASDDAGEGEDGPELDAEGERDGGERRRSRRRGRRGGRRNRRGEREGAGEPVASPLDVEASDLVAVAYEDRSPEGDPPAAENGEALRAGEPEIRPMWPGPETLSSGPGSAESSVSFARVAVEIAGAPAYAGEATVSYAAQQAAIEAAPAAEASPANAPEETAYRPAPPSSGEVASTAEQPLAGPPRKGWWNRRTS